jgi:hypothetical protein
LSIIRTDPNSFAERVLREWVNGAHGCRPLRRFAQRGQAGEVTMEIGEEMERAGAIALYSFGPEGRGEDLDLGGKELVESWLCRLKWMA